MTDIEDLIKGMLDRNLRRTAIMDNLSVAVVWEIHLPTDIEIDEDEIKNRMRMAYIRFEETMMRIQKQIYDNYWTKEFVKGQNNDNE